MKEIISHCLLVISKEENFLLMSTLVRSGNNFLYSGACPPLAGPHKIHGYDTTVNEAFLKRFNLLRSRFLELWGERCVTSKKRLRRRLKEVWCDVRCVYPWILCGPATGGQAPPFFVRCRYRILQHRKTNSFSSRLRRSRLAAPPPKLT